MTTLPVFGGPLKREIIKRAYGMCGQAAYEFELEPEEYDIGLQCLNDQMATIAYPTYNTPTYGNGSPEDESGIDPADVLGAAAFTAQLLGPTIGKVPSMSAPSARAASQLLMKCSPTPQMEMGRNTIRGAGNRWQRQWGPYFFTDISPNEIDQ